MKERPILFKGEMVRAILDGRKTQTRRLFSSSDLTFFLNAARAGEVSYFLSESELLENDLDYVIDSCRFGKVGDRFWVRETFREFNNLDECGCSESPCPCPSTGTPIYRADQDDGESKWKPSIFMPRKHSRIALEITDVRVHRLQDISEEDAEAEGCYSNDQYGDLAGSCDDLWPCHSCRGNQVHGALGSALGWTEVDCIDCDTPKKRFKYLWKSINGPESWELNPWVWAISFKVIK